MAVHEHHMDGRSPSFNSMLLPELKAAVRKKSHEVNGLEVENNPSSQKVLMPKPRMRAVASTAVSSAGRKQSSGNDTKRPDMVKFKPVPAPRKNVPKVRQRKSSSGGDNSREGTPGAIANVVKESSEGSLDDSPWEDDEPVTQQKEKSTSPKRRQHKPPFLGKNRFMRKKPPEKPLRSPGTFDRAAQLHKVTGSDNENVNDEDGENIYDDVGEVITLDREEGGKSNENSKEQLVEVKIALLPKRNCDVYSPAWSQSKHCDSNHATRNDARVQSCRDNGIVNMAQASSDHSKQNTPRMPSKEILYCEPLVHDSTPVVGVEHTKHKSPPKRRVVPKPPVNDEASPRRQRPPVPIRPRPNASHSAKQVPVVPRMRQYRSDNTLDVIKQSEETDEGQHNGDALLSVQFRPRSVSSQNLSLCDNNNDNEDEGTLKRCQSFDSESTLTSSQTAESMGTVAPFYHELDIQRESICPSRDSAAVYDAVSSLGREFVLPDVGYRDVGARRVSTDSMGSTLGRRMLWAEQQQVMESGMLDSLSEQERKLQEALYEVVTSEASYHHSLSILIENFMEAPELSDSLPEGRRILDKQQRHVLFSNLAAVWEVATQFHEALQKRLQQSVKIDTVCDIIQDFAVNRFDVYVKYCSNQLFQNRLLNELNSTNPEFAEVVRRLESNSVAQSLLFSSFLILPVQRITRLALLILAILDRTPADSPSHKLATDALTSVQNVVDRCNEGARSMERTEQMIALSKLVRFDKLKGLPLISPKRWLLKRGPVTQLITEKMLTRVKINKQTLHIFVFTDLILVTKQKRHLTEEWFSTIDYGFRPFLQLEDVEDPPYTSSAGKHATDGYALASSGCRNAFKLVLLENAHKKTASYFLSVDTETDKARWMDAIQPPLIEHNGSEEVVYTQFDCPQVQATYNYSSQQADELDLTAGDVMKVIRKMPDGWYEGERLRDGEVGWFPSTYVTEIESEHNRARNLKQRYQLIRATEHLLPHSAVLRKTRSRLSELFG